MKFDIQNLGGLLLFLLLATLGFAHKVNAITVAKGDILLHIVSQCIESSNENYCSKCMFPLADAQCGISECKKTNEVWALKEEFVAIRDIKMCGCPPSFIHGLVMPREIVTGIEDPNRQEGIWQFAWDVAIQRIEPESLALVVNPKSERTQNQLHVHMLRLDKTNLSNFAQYDPIYIDSLEKVWATTEKVAQNKGLMDYGVLVARGTLGKYMVVVMPHSPEAAFTIWSCE